jgi:hypothetical protein
MLTAEDAESAEVFLPLLLCDLDVLCGSRF